MYFFCECFINSMLHSKNHFKDGIKRRACYRNVTIFKHARFSFQKELFTVFNTHAHG